MDTAGADTGGSTPSGGQTILDGDVFLAGGRSDDPLGTWSLMRVGDEGHYLAGFEGNKYFVGTTPKQDLPVLAWSLFQGALIYIPEFDSGIVQKSLRTFNVDLEGTLGDAAPYPQKAAANDASIPTPMCPANDTPDSNPDRVLASSLGDGRLIYRCKKDSQWYAGTQQVLTNVKYPDIPKFLSGDLVLFGPADEGVTLGHLDSDETHPVALGGSSNFWAFRERDGGFQATRYNLNMNAFELVDIDDQGNVTSLGFYPPSAAPFPSGTARIWEGRALDAQGRLYLFVRASADGPAEFVRLTLDTAAAESLLLPPEQLSIVPKQLLVP